MLEELIFQLTKSASKERESFRIVKYSYHISMVLEINFKVRREWQYRGHLQVRERGQEYTIVFSVIFVFSLLNERSRKERDVCNSITSNNHSLTGNFSSLQWKNILFDIFDSRHILPNFRYKTALQRRVQLA
jgi:hypothetical protein